ncbi:jg590, partial [Pararge aegeria aegeria]
MTARLILINLKVDDYVYKKKPISIEEAYKYAREIETFRRQCHDERCLQVIEKLSSYMKFLIREQSTKDIEDVNVTHQTEPIEELHTENDNGTYTAGPQCNTIDTEVDQSALDLSIGETKDSLASSDINDKKIINQNSLSTITQENLNEAYVNKNDTRHHIMIESEIAKVNTINQNQTDIVDVTSIKPQNLL